MKSATRHILLILLFSLTPISFGATPVLGDANRLLDFAEAAEPMLFFPTAETLQVNAAGSDWFYRYYSGSDSYIAININGNGPQFGGEVYVLGEQFGESVLYVETLENLLGVIDSTEPLPAPVVSAITNIGNGNCTPRKFAAKNDTASFRTSTFSGGTTTITARSEFYEEVTATQTVTVIEQTTSIGGAETVTSNRYTTNYESSSGMLFKTENDSTITTSATGSPSTLQNINITYAPSLFLGPADSLCEGQEWTVAAVTQTLIDDSNQSGPVTTQTLPTSGRIDSVGEEVTVPGGTFSTVKMTLTYPDSRTIVWTDINFGVVVMSETYQGSSESPSSVEELTLFELPF